MGDGPAHIGTAELDHPGLRLGFGYRRQLGVQVAEALFGDGGQQRGLVGEVPVRGRGADAGAPRSLGQREALRPLLRHQRQRGAGQRPLEVAVVVALAPCGGAGPCHVDDINIVGYVNAIHIPQKGQDP